jgi:hypothetical protein
MRCELELDGFKKRWNVPHAHNMVFLLNPGAFAFCSNDKSDDLCLIIRETSKMRITETHSSGVALGFNKAGICRI